MAGCGASPTSGLGTMFGPELGGPIRSEPVKAGHYKMNRKTNFEMFVTTELRITEVTMGSMEVVMIDDGRLRLCAQVEGRRVNEGQYHYEPDPSRRGYPASNITQIVGFTGRWKSIDGIAVLALDKMGEGSCEEEKVVVDTHKEMRCIGFSKTERIPTGGIACVAGEGVLGLGLPLVGEVQDRFEAPQGRGFLLGAPSMDVKVEQEREATARIVLGAGGVADMFGFPG